MNITYNELQEAVRLIFDKKLQNGTTVRMPDPADLRKHFYRLVMRWHPDRTSITGEDPGQSADMFKKISNAYQLLLQLAGRKVRLGHAAPVPPEPVRPESPHQEKAFTDSSFREKKARTMPRSRLRFAQYLYHKGIIDWHTIIEALVWQKENRPLVGEIGREFGYFANPVIDAILRNRSLGDPFCKAAVNLGVINTFQASAMIGRQRQYGAPIGHFFLEKHILTTTELGTCLEEFHEFNRQF